MAPLARAGSCSPFILKTKLSHGRLLNPSSSSDLCDGALALALAAYAYVRVYHCCRNERARGLYTTTVQYVIVVIFRFITVFEATAEFLRTTTEVKRRLTISAHAHGNAFLQSAVLAAVAIYPQDAALLVLRAGAVLDLLLDRASEESLRKDKWKNSGSVGDSRKQSRFV